MGGVSTLAAAAILRSLTDADLERCKGFRHFSVSQILLLVLLFFAIVAIFGEVAFDQVRVCFRRAWTLSPPAPRPLTSADPHLPLGLSHSPGRHQSPIS